MRRWLKRIVVLGTAVLLMSIIGLEIVSRTYSCRDKVAPDFMVIKICEQERTVYNEEEMALLEELRTKRTAGISISKATYREAIDRLVTEVEPDLLGPANGAICTIAYVRNDLPAQAKLFVKRHEFEHLLQEPGMENLEVAANVVAAKAYPLGLVQTVLYSLQEAKKDMPWLCFLISSWSIFKIYFLGIGG